jgi:hypothetical protein
MRLEAGERAAGRLAHVEAIAHHERGLALLQSQPASAIRNCSNGGKRRSAVDIRQVTGRRDLPPKRTFDFRQSDLSATAEHIASCEIAEGHPRGQLHPRLITNPLLGRGGNIARSVKPRNGVATLVDDPTEGVGQKAR